MGFFKRLFGVSSGGYLSTMRTGGYDKSDVLAIADAYNTYIFELIEAVEDKKAGRPFTMPAQPVIKPMRSARMGGYDKADTEAYYADLRAKIAKLEEQLKE